MSITSHVQATAIKSRSMDSRDYRTLPPIPHGLSRLALALSNVLKDEALAVPLDLSIAQPFFITFSALLSLLIRFVPRFGFSSQSFPSRQVLGRPFNKIFNSLVL